MNHAIKQGYRKCVDCRCWSQLVDPAALGSSYERWEELEYRLTPWFFCRACIGSFKKKEKKIKPLVHAKCSVRRYGGCIDDYLKLHEWMDQTKAHVPDMRHRSILHSSFGIYLATDFFGDYFTNCDGRTVATRDVLEEHVLEDMGRIPTVQDYLAGMPFYDWLGGQKSTKRTIELNIVD